MATHGVLERYDGLVKAGTIAFDLRQEAVACALDDVVDGLLSAAPRKEGLLGRLPFRRRPSAGAAGGLYLWGDVGRGKTMLMDLFFETAPVGEKRRAHFNDFMQDVHRRIAAARERILDGRLKADDPVEPVAADLVREARLLCFDEFAVTDIADAMILGRLFRAMFERGLTLVATSNVAPDDLYEGGLNRDHFMQFVELLKGRVRVMRLDAAGDYRLDRLRSATVWFPSGAEGRSALDRLWRQMTGGARPAPVALAVAGRTVTVERAVGGLARFSFEELCARPLGAGDYLAIAHRFHTVFLEDVPVLSAAMRNEARRFITLVDVLYDNRMRLVLSAAAEPEGLFEQVEGDAGYEGFAFARTASRLHEMRSEGWIRSVEEPPLT